MQGPICWGQKSQIPCPAFACCMFANCVQRRKIANLAVKCLICGTAFIAPKRKQHKRTTAVGTTQRQLITKAEVYCVIRCCPCSNGCIPKKPNIAQGVWCHTIPARYCFPVHIHSAVLHADKALLGQSSIPTRSPHKLSFTLMHVLRC